jgi:tetratricopeptide (TPR) repeat protein
VASIAHCYFAVALTEQGNDQDCADSVAWTKRAIALEPHNARLYADLGEHCALATLDYVQAARAYRKAIELNPSDMRALIGAASLYGVPEEVVTAGEVISWLERATQLEPGNPNYHARLGELHWQAGRASEAKREWSRALLCPPALDEGYVQMIMGALGADHDRACPGNVP